MSVIPEPETVELATLGNQPVRLSPFLRWAGGKRWLVPQVLELLRNTPVARYHEPFLGGASVFFSLPITEKAFLSDLNVDLIEVYTQVRDHAEEVASQLGRFENNADAYYAVRANIPNTPLERAARFIYLNHTSYNGIFRVNLKGVYNVPFGYRKSMNMPDEDWLVQASQRLMGAELSGSDFETALLAVEEGDLVFLDPPYTVAHNNNGFVKYNQHLFSFEDQERLALAIERLVTVGAKFILTNAAHASIDQLFSPLGRKLTVSRRNAIGGKSATRGSAEEYVFTNIGVK